MTKNDVAALVKIVDGHHVETLTKIEEVKADVAEVKADVAKLSRTVNTRWTRDTTPC